MNRKKLHLMMSGIFLLAIIFAAFAAPVQAEENLCWEVEILVGGSGAVFINRGFGNWRIIASSLTPGDTFTYILSLPPGGGATLASPGTDYWIGEPWGPGFEVLFNGNHHLVHVGAASATPWEFNLTDRSHGSATLLPYEDAGACHGANLDGRLNPNDVSVNAALYNYMGGLRVYMIDEATSQGWLAIDASAAEVNAAIAEAQATGVNQLIGSESGVHLSALFSGCLDGAFDDCVQMNYSHYDGTPRILIVGR